MFNAFYDNSEEILQETMDVLQEANKVKFDKKTLKKRMLTQCELLVAKDDEPALFNAYVKATKRRKKARALIHAKCATKAKAKLRQLLLNRKAGK